MTFVHPWLLLGAAAALIPLLIHLFDRRRPRTVPFAAIAFVLRSQRRTASRLKLRRLLLYALRTLVLLALPVALARPELRETAARAQAGHGLAATAIVLDASLPMRFTDGTSLFERGRALALDALKDLAPEEPANLTLCGLGAGPPASPGFERARMHAALEEAQPTYGGADLNRCLELAAKSLEDSPLPNKRVVVVSAFTAPSLRLDLPPPTLQGPKGEALRVEWVLKDAAQGRAALPNHAIVDLKVEAAPQVAPRAYQYTFTVRNYAAEPVKDLVALLKVGDRTVAKGFLELPAGGSVQKSFTHAFETGGVFSGRVELAADGLAEDDARAFVVQVPHDIRALVVNGAPNNVRYRDEAFFVDAALSASNSPVHETLRDAESAFHETFEAYDLILLLNVRAPSPEVAARLAEFVRKGGGLFISVGDEVEPDAYNARFGDLLPRAMRLPKTAALAKDADADAKAAKFGQVDFGQALFTIFSGKAQEGLMSARFYRYILLESADLKAEGESAQVLAAFDDGAPAFALARRGRGRVLLYTSTVDRTWADLAIRTAFLPLLQRACALLTGSLEEHEELRATVGDTVALKGDAPHTLSAVKGPSPRTVPLRTEPNGQTLVGPLAEPGLYQPLDEKGGAMPALGFAVRLDPAQSDLTRLKPEELTAYFGEGAVKQGGASEQERRTPFWTWLLVVAAVAFFLEGLLLRRG